MANSMKFRDFRTNTEVEAADEKQARILEQGGYVRVTANTPSLHKAQAQPSTVAEHVAAARKAEQAQGTEPAVTEPGDVVVAAVETVEEPETRPANSGRKGSK